MPRPIGKLSLANCLDKHFNHPLRLFCVYQFLHLVYPFATSAFRRISALLRVHPSLCLVCEGVLHLTGAPLDSFTSILFVRSGNPSNAFTYSAYSTSTGSPPDSYRVPPLRLSVSPGGFIPDAANTSGPASGGMHRFFLHR